VPAKQAGSYYRTSDGWGVRWYEGGRRRYQSGFESKSAARGYFGDVVQPRLKGRPAAMAAVTFGELVERCLRAHAVAVQPRTLRSLQERLRRRPYALRHTGISQWLAAGILVFDVSRYAGTSLQMIERTYGHLVAGSVESARRRMDEFQANNAAEAIGEGT
jgi:hypothetical protein